MKALAVAAALAALMAPAAWGAGWCGDGMEPVAKKADGSVACVTPGTAQILIERGWGTEAPEAPAVAEAPEIADFLKGAAIPPSFTAEERAWLAENPEIFVAYDPGWAPYEYLDRGSLSGLAEYLMPVFTDVSGSSFVQHDTDSWTGALEAVREGDDRVLLAVGITDERKEYLGYTEPHTKLSWNIVTLAGSDLDPSSLEAYEVGVIRNYAVVAWLDENMPELQYSEYETEDGAFEALVSGRTDALIQAWGVALASADKQGVSVSNAGSIGDDLLLAAAYPKGEEVLGSIMQKLVAAVPGEKYAELEARAVLDYRLDGAERQWLESNPVVTVGIDTDWPPYEYVEDGRVSGQTKLYMDEIGRLTGLEFATDTRPWDQVVESQKDGNATALFAVAKTPERLEFMDFTRPYAPALWSLVTASEQSLEPADLAGLKSGSVRGYAVQEWMETNMPGAEFAAYDDHASAYEALKSGELDVFLDSWDVVSVSAARLGVDGLYNSGALDASDPISPIAIGYPKSQQELGSVLQKALDAIPPERRQLFAAKATFEALATEDQKEWLSGSPVVRVAYDPDGAPFEYRGQDGAIAGLAAGYMPAVSYVTGLRFEQADTPTWDAALEAMEGGEADAMFALAETPERLEFMGFTRPYATVPWNVVASSEGAVDLASARAGTIGGYAIESWLDENMPDLEYSSYPDHAAALEALSSGEIDALLDTFEVVRAAAGEDAQLFDAGTVGDGLDFAVGYSLRIPELGGVLQSAMDAMPEALHASIYSAAG